MFFSLVSQELAMTQQKSGNSVGAALSGNSELIHNPSVDSSLSAPTSKKQVNWQCPAFEELDLGMEVTAYVNYWQ